MHKRRFRACGLRTFDASCRAKKTDQALCHQLAQGPLPERFFLAQSNMTTYLSSQAHGWLPLSGRMWNCSRDPGEKLALREIGDAEGLNDCGIHSGACYRAHAGTGYLSANDSPFNRVARALSLLSSM